MGRLLSYLNLVWKISSDIVGTLSVLAFDRPKSGLGNMPFMSLIVKCDLGNQFQHLESRSVLHLFIRI